MGTINLTDAVNGRITATAKDEDSARKLADVARGFVALGQLAGKHQADVAELMKGISIAQDRNAVRLVVNFPFDLLEKLEQREVRSQTRAVTLDTILHRREDTKKH